MATRQFTTDVICGSTVRVTWSGLLNGDDGAPFFAPDHVFKEFQVTGAFGVGGNVIVEGTLLAALTPYATLNDVQGNAQGTITAAKIERLQETTGAVRPRVSAGDGSTNLVFTMICKLDGATAS